jgi:hypothetical protein
MKMNVIIANAFSLSMLDKSESLTQVSVEQVSVERVRDKLAGGFVSAIGHESTARVLTDTLGVPVAVARVNVRIAKGDLLVVAQFHGARLPEGATTLPEGASLDFAFVRNVGIA